MRSKILRLALVVALAQLAGCGGGGDDGCVVSVSASEAPVYSFTGGDATAIEVLRADSGDVVWSSEGNLESPVRHGQADGAALRESAATLAPGGYLVRVVGENSMCESEFAVKPGPASLSNNSGPSRDPRQPSLVGR